MIWSSVHPTLGREPDRGEDDNQEYPDRQRALRLDFNDSEDFDG
jgi:hypothetical protein